MTAAEAARLGDDIGHTSAWDGMLAGIAIGLLVGAAIAFTVVTGGTGAILLGAVFTLGMGASGGLLGMAIGQRNEGNIKGKIGSGSPDVITVSQAQARVFLDFIICDDHGSAERIASGSSTVLVNGEMAARRNDYAECSGKLHTDQETVLIGGEAALDPRLTIRPEISENVVLGLTILAWAGGIAGGLLMVPVIGAVAATVSFAGGIVGGIFGGRLGRWVGSNWGEETAFWGEIIGGFAGGMLGGFSGARAGITAQSRLPRTTLAAMRGRTPAQIKARQEVAYDHFAAPRPGRDGTIGRMSNSEIASKMQGIDFEHPVRVYTTTRPMVKQQAQNAGQTWSGNFVSDHGVEPGQVGVGPHGAHVKTGEVLPKQISDVEVPAGTTIMESRAGPINDIWSTDMAQWTQGGRQQYYVHDKSGLNVVEGSTRPSTPRHGPPQAPSTTPNPPMPTGVTRPPKWAYTNPAGLAGSNPGGVPGDDGGDP